MGSLQQEELQNRHRMRAAAGFLLAAAGLAVSSALEVSNGKVDEEHEAIVVEGGQHLCLVLTFHLSHLSQYQSM